MTYKEIEESESDLMFAYSTAGVGGRSTRPYPELL